MSHFRGLKLSVILFIPLFLLLRLGLLVLCVFAKFYVISLKHVIRLFFRPTESKKLAIEAQNDPTRAYRGKYHGSRQFRKKQRQGNVGGSGKRPPRARRGRHHIPWWMPCLWHPLSPMVAQFSSWFFDFHAF